MTGTLGPGENPVSGPAATAAILSIASRGGRQMGRSVATYYDILRVGHGADPEGLRTAYRRLAQKYHPDKLPNNADAVRVMAMLNEAYGVLSDPQQRARYDRRIQDAQAHAGRAKRRVVAPVDVPTAAWPWDLLFPT